MQFEHLHHKHGGRITAVHQITHNTHRGRAYWEFIGRIEWADGTTSEAGHIAPVLLCSDNDAGRAEVDALLAQLSEYLTSRGAWDGRTWKPAAKTGAQAI